MSEFVWKTMKKKTKKKINKRRTWKESSIFRESECLLRFFSFLILLVSELLCCFILAVFVFALL
jgi:hypothetical protein